MVTEFHRRHYFFKSFHNFFFRLLFLIKYTSSRPLETSSWVCGPLGRNSWLVRLLSCRQELGRNFRRSSPGVNRKRCCCCSALDHPGRKALPDSLSKRPARILDSSWDSEPLCKINKR
jgi:hypothetical protein